MRRGRSDALWHRAADPRVVGAALVAACVALTALAVKTPWSPLPRWGIATAGLAASAAVWWSGRRPVAVTVAGAIAHALSGNPGPLLVGLLSGGATLRPRHLPALLVLGTAGFAAPDVMAAGTVTAGPLVSAAVLAGVLLTASVALGTRAALVGALRERAERAEAEHHLRAEQARTGERTRIAREMHDVLAHKVSLIALHAGALEVDPAAGPDRVADAAALIGTTARAALDDLRAVLGILRPEGDGDGTAAADRFTDIGALVASWREAGVVVRLHRDTAQLPAPVARAAYRLVQEGLTNAYKHAAGAEVDVTVTDTVDGAVGGVAVRVVNGPPGAGTPGLSGARGLSGTSGTSGAPGTSGTPAPRARLPGAGTGLVGLAERLRLVGATLHSGPAGGGWVLEGRFPEHPSPAQDAAPSQGGSGTGAPAATREGGAR